MSDAAKKIAVLQRAEDDAFNAVMAALDAVRAAERNLTEARARHNAAVAATLRAHLEADHEGE